MREKKIGSLTVANRTLSRAQELAEKFNAEAILLSDIHDQLSKSDIVISSTASQLPILGKGAVESALKVRKHKPIFMVDIAVPRDIEPEVEKLPDVYLYTVDDLKEVIDENVRSREDAAEKATQIIEDGVEAWRRQCRAQDVVGTIRSFRDSMETVRDIELEKALSSLRKGEDPAKLLTALARSLTNKLLHTPTANIKRAGEEGRTEHIHWAHQLLGLDRSEDKK